MTIKSCCSYIRNGERYAQSYSVDKTFFDRSIEVIEARILMLVTIHDEGGKSYSAVPRIRTQMRRYADKANLNAKRCKSDE